MTSLDPQKITELAREQHRQIRDCIAIEVVGPRCPICHAEADHPEHGANRRKITRPGKFEGEREILRDAYHLYLEGGADSDDGDVVTVTLDDGTEVAFVETEQGFIIEVELPE